MNQHSPQTPCIITHGDLDGMVCAILFLQRLPRATPIAIANDRTLAKELRVLGESVHIPECVYISDIPITSRTADDVESAIRRLTRQGSAVHWYDHHRSWLEESLQQRFQNVCSRLIIDTKRTTAAASVWTCFLDRDPQAQHWLRLLSEKDGSDDATIHDQFGLLAALQQPLHFRLTEETLKALAFGEPLAAEQRRLITWYYEEHLRQARELAESAQVTETRGGRRVGWVDLRGQRERFHLPPLVAETHSVDLVATVSDDCIRLGTESIDAGVDLSPLHGRHQSESTEFTIVGHRSPVKILPRRGGISDAFLKTVRTFVREKL